MAMVDEEPGGAAALGADAPGWAAGGPMWGGLNALLSRGTALSPDVSLDSAHATQTFLRESCRVLVIGAGGLGCELLKDVALSGFRRIDVIDLDTIDVTNLNRQFLFRARDVGRPKAVVAADFVNARVPGVAVTPHHANIMDFDSEFYRGFNLVIAGLDSVDARRWLNATLVDLVELDEDGNPDPTTVIPLIDGGTEGFQGQARVILPRFNACFECTLALFPPPRNFPLCTIANTPRLPEHCVEYANVVLWPRENPYGPGTKLDADNPDHTAWLFDTAKKRADEFGITGVTYRLTQGVAKNIIPAVASTNAIVAAACASEALKLCTYIAPTMDNYSMYNGTAGVYTFTYQNERRPDCPACGKPRARTMTVKRDLTLDEFVEQLGTDPDLRSHKPFLRTGGGKTLYAAAPAALQKATKKNLSMKLGDLIAEGDTELTLVDSAVKFGRTILIKFDD